MDDDAVVKATKSKVDAANKVRDNYVQLAEKMEQVKNQVAKMERKYDELYQSVKAKEHGSSRSRGNVSDSGSQEDNKNQRESIDDITIALPKNRLQQQQQQPTDDSNAQQSSATQKEKTDSSQKQQNVDYEKMEDNPFL